MFAFHNRSYLQFSLQGCFLGKHILSVLSMKEGVREMGVSTDDVDYNDLYVVSLIVVSNWQPFTHRTSYMYFGLCLAFGLKP